MIYLILLLISTVALQDVESISTDWRTITGRVVDESKAPVLFCNVLAYDKENKLLTGVSSDIEGKFTISVSSDCQWLEASYTGMQTARIAVSDANDYCIVLKAGIELSSGVIHSYKIGWEHDVATSGGVDPVRNLPTKNINAISATTAGLSAIDGGDISIRGSRDDATSYYIDGIRASAPEMDATTGPPSTNPVVPGATPAPPIQRENRYLAGQLTAGEINDFGKWVLWNDKSQEQLTEYRRVWDIYPLERFMVIAQNTEGIPLVGQTIYLLDDEKNVVWTAKTDNTGKAELWSNMFDKTYKEGYAFTISTKVNRREYTIQHTKRFEQGVNLFTLKRDCNLSNVIDAVFVVDATGSMSDELQYLQQELMDVITKVKDRHEDMTLNLGSVFYRDHGEEYITRTSALTTDITKTNQFIESQFAVGGGDGPEAMDEALEIAIGDMNWTSGARTKLLFVVMDAPPHSEPDNLERIRKVAYAAAREGIKIIPLTASGLDKSTEYLMRALALCTNGTYVFLTDHSGIGNPHLEPTTDTYDVLTLNDLLIRLFDQYINAVSCDEAVEPDTLTISDTLEIQNGQVSSADTFPDFHGTSIGSVEAKVTCKYYPNPTTGLLNIDVTGKIQELFLCDASGKLLQRFEMHGDDKVQLDISPYPIGIYRIMYFETDNEPRSGMVVLAR